MPDEPQAMLAEVIDLLDQVGARLGALGSTSPDDDATSAAETGAMHRARASHARERAQDMRDGLEDVRRRAVAIAEEMRGRRAERRRDAEGSPAAAWWDHVAAAADRLLDARIEDHGDVLDHLLEAARTVLPAAAGVGLVWCDDDGGFATLHHDDDDVLDALAEHVRRTGSGPAPAALAGDVVEVPDLRRDARWPDLAADAPALGVGSLLVVRLTAEGQDRGRDRGPHLAAVFHAPRPHAFGTVAVTAARLLARQTAVLLLGARRVGGLLRALEGRDVIGQAKGILVSRDGITPDEAFTRLTEASQSTNVKLRDVATWLVEQTRQG
ncbi:GAF and ANTAR domain-containing protein [Actinomycetospora chiangmaiensis]|uniref:GAF and ANTAR domain-containing protein n=1 Tax=Actinomycetospora chiangmaiensis TaxID=402650 RepID=UPI00037683D2|nr:GAF and ANTAR domain-containing protein [Actinomycetospora chiangmaiensis]